MSCDPIRDMLLERSVSAFGDLREHLERCPDCAALAARIEAQERGLRVQQEAFVSAPIPGLPVVTDLVVAGGRGPRLFHGALVVLALAAVLTLAVLGGGEVPARRAFVHGNPPPELTRAVGLVDAFLQQADRGCPPLDGLDRPDQDAVILGHLSDLTEALSAAEEHLVELSEDEDPMVTVIAAWELGALYEGMAEALANFRHPLYLNEDQAELYQMALEDKAWAQHEKARAAWELALEQAEAAGLEPEADASAEALVDLEERMAELEQVPEPDPPPPGAEDRLRAKIATLEARLERCKDLLSEDSFAELREVVDQGRSVIDGEETSLYADMLAFLDAYEHALEAACPR